MSKINIDIKNRLTRKESLKLLAYLEKEYVVEKLRRKSRNGTEERK